MATRVISPEIFEDEWFGELEDRDALVWIGLFGVIADDQGRFLERPVVIRGRIFIYRDVPTDDVVSALQRFVDDQRLHRYTAGDERLLQIVKWWEHQKPQWARPSAYPSPEGWADRIRHRQNGKYTESGWASPGGFTCDVQVKPPGEPFRREVQVNPSPEDLTRSLQVGPSPVAHEPEPIPEPGTTPPTVPPSGGDESVTPPIPEPEREPPEREERPTVPVENHPPNFAAFWNVYPRKIGKPAAEKIWRRLKAPERRQAVAGAGHLATWQADTGTDLTFIPYPSTFLNQRRGADWENGPPPGHDVHGADRTPSTEERPDIICGKCGEILHPKELADQRQVHFGPDGWQHGKCPS